MHWHGMCLFACILCIQHVHACTWCLVLCWLTAHYLHHASVKTAEWNTLLEHLCHAGQQVILQRANKHCSSKGDYSQQGSRLQCNALQQALSKSPTKPFLPCIVSH
eukprot:GHRR01025851.1.p2 GENE.GHRR01025851.1~~GHRR01025851.1.p2  ORF type:complete len:106 (+),score=20.09 GHRR01025851.1:774-1091(+)